MSRRLGALTAALVAALVLLGATAPAASAHAALMATTPAQAQVVATAPAEVSLTFGEAVTTDLGAVKVLSSSGERADDGPVRQSDGGRIVHLALRSGLADGTYVVVWRVVSADSHPVSGTFSFSIGRATTLTGYAARTAAPRGPGLLLGGTRLLGFAGLLLWLGGALFVLLLWPEGVAARAVRGLLVTAVAVELGAAVAALLLQGPYAAGMGLRHVLDPTLLRDVLHTRYGTATATRVVLAAVALGGCLLLRRAPRPVLGGLTGLGVATAVTWSAAGHGGSGDLQPYAAVLDTTHLLATSAWVGGLAMLGLALRRWDDPVAARVLPQWSRWATWAVALLVGSGLFAGYREVRSFSALTTTYGELLGLKTLLVAGMLFGGLTGRMWVRRHYGIAPRPGRARAGTVVHAAEADATDAHLPPDEAAVAILRRSVRMETVIAVAVLAVTAVLVQTAPAASATAKPYSGTSTAGAYRVQVDLYPARKGLNELHLYTLGPGGRTEDVAEVTGSMVRPDGESFTVRPVHVSLGHYEDLQVVLPASGSYHLMLQVRTSDIDSFPSMQTIRVP